MSSTNDARRTAALTSAHPFLQVIAHAQRVGHNRESRIDSSRRGEEAAVDDVEVVDVVRPAIRIQDRRLGIAAEADGAVLVCHTGEGNPIADEQIA